jgi:hypothetical protein
MSTIGDVLNIISEQGKILAKMGNAGWRHVSDDRPGLSCQKGDTILFVAKTKENSWKEVVEELLRQAEEHDDN